MEFGRGGGGDAIEHVTRHEVGVEGLTGRQLEACGGGDSLPAQEDGDGASVLQDGGDGVRDTATGRINDRRGGSGNGYPGGDDRDAPILPV